MARRLSRSRRHATTHSLVPVACDAFLSFDPSIRCRRGRSPHTQIREAWMVGGIVPTSPESLPGPPESLPITIRFRTERWSRLVVAFCLVTTSATARSQETGPPDDHDPTADRSSGSLPGQKARRKPQTEESTPARRSFPMGAVPGFGLAIPREAAVHRFWTSTSKRNLARAGSSGGTSSMLRVQDPDSSRPLDRTPILPSRRRHTSRRQDSSHRRLSRHPLRVSRQRPSAFPFLSTTGRIFATCRLLWIHYRLRRCLQPANQECPRMPKR